MPNPRKEFVDFLGKHDPTAVERLVINIATLSETEFAEVCALAEELAQAQDAKDAIAVARAEVAKKPKKEARAVDTAADAKLK